MVRVDSAPLSRNAAQCLYDALLVGIVGDGLGETVRRHWFAGVSDRPVGYRATMCRWWAS